MNKNKYCRPAIKVAILAMFIIAMLSLTACAFLQSIVSSIQGQLIGEDFLISEYDNFGSKNFTLTGNKVNLKADVDSEGEPTSYIDISIDGHKWQHVGSTLVFTQNGIDMITDFSLPEDIQYVNNVSSGLMPVDRFINHYKNLIGKDKTILVCTQNGTPIGLFQGKDAYIEIPEDLPKTTMAYIDGKRIYVHRADIDIFDTDMLDTWG